MAPCSVEATRDEKSFIHFVKPVGFLSESHVIEESLNLSIETIVNQTGLISEPHEDSAISREYTDILVPREVSGQEEVVL